MPVWDVPDFIEQQAADTKGSFPMAEVTESNASRRYDGAIATVMSGLERFGLPTVLLLAFAYVTHTGVILPIATRYADLVREVQESNKMLAAAITGLERDAHSAAIENTRAIEDALKSSEKSRETIFDSLQKIEENTRGMRQDIADLSDKLNRSKAVAPNE